MNTNKSNRHFDSKGNGHKRQTETFSRELPDQHYDELVEYARNNQSEEFENFLDDHAFNTGR